MPLDFPTSPSLNDTYSFGGKTWLWNGEGWQLASSGAINNIPIGNVTASTGNFTSLEATGFTSTGNITTGNILTDGYYYANGDPFVSSNYGDSNVVTLLSAFGSNTIATTGNVDTGNLSGAAAAFTGLSVSAANLSVLFTDSHATASAVRQFRIKSGPRELALAANLTAGNYNSLTSANDLAIVITGPDQGNANLAIIPWASATSGIRISSISNVATITVAATTINHSGAVFATGNVQAANVVSNAAITGTTVTATGNVTGGNIITAGAVTATGNVQTAANVVYANAAGSPQAYQFYNSSTSSIDTVFI